MKIRRTHKIRRQVSRSRGSRWISGAGRAFMSMLSSLPIALDSAIFSIAPSWGEKRRRSRKKDSWFSQQSKLLQKEMLSRFEAADNPVIRQKRWLTDGLGLDQVDETRLRTLKDRMQELWDDDCFAKSAIEGRVKQVVGLGLNPQSKIKAMDGLTQDQADDINAQLEDKFKLWGMQCGVQGQSLWQLQRLAERSLAIKGEAFVILSDRATSNDFIQPPVPLKIEVIDGDRCETPPGESGVGKVRLGIEYASTEGDQANDIVAYHFRRTGPDGTISHERIPARMDNGQLRVLHLFDQQLPNQTRGLPWLVAAMNSLRDLKDATEARLIAFQVQSLFCAFVHTTSNPEKLADATSDAIKGSERLEDMAPGMVHYLGDDEEIEFADPKQPGSEFREYTKGQLHGVAAAGDYPYELLGKDWENTTFSSGRLSMLDGRLSFRTWQQLHNHKSNNHIWQRFVVECVIGNEVDIDLSMFDRNPELFCCAVEFKGTGWPALQPEKEVRAAMEEIDSGLNTRQNYIDDKGGDFDEVAKQLKREREVLIAAGLNPEIALGNIPAQEEEQSQQPTNTPAGAVA